MKVTIYKYLRPSIANSNDYYFYNPSNVNSKLSYYDKFEMNRQLVDSFPIFREEWSQEDNVDILKTGFFDMKLAISMSERSYTMAHSIYEFFENVEAGIGNFKYVVVCETGNIARTYSGVMDVNTLKANVSVNDKEYYITFSVTGIEKEVVDLMKLYSIRRIGSNFNFDNQYLLHLLNDILSDKLTLQSNLDLVNKLGYELTIDRSRQNKFYDAHYNSALHRSNFKIWDAFKSFVIGYAFKFKVIYDGNDGQFPLFKLVLFYRSDALNETTITKYLKHEKAFATSANKYVAMFYTQKDDSFSGFIMNITDIIVADSDHTIDYLSGLNAYRIPGESGEFIISANNVLRISLDLYDATLPEGNYAYCRLVVGNTIDPLLTYIANTQLGYLLKGSRAKKNLTIKVPDDSNIILGTKAEIDNKSYTLERITSFDNFNNKMETEWIEQ